MSRVAEQIDVLKLTQERIRFNTNNPPDNEGGLALFIGKLLIKNGFEVDYPIYAKDRLQLVATKGISKDFPPIIFTGHLDVIPLGANQWSNDPFLREIVDEKLYGRGATDMKGGMAAMIVAAIEVFRHESPRGGIKLSFTADEELGCNGAQHLCKSGYDLAEASTIVVGEPTANMPYVGHKGDLYLNAYIKGITSHSSMPELGDNAISTSEENDFIQMVFDILELSSSDEGLKKSAIFLTDALVFTPFSKNIPKLQMKAKKIMAKQFY